MGSHSISKITHVAAKQAAVDNAVLPSTVALQLELAEINKALASNPSRLDAPLLNARKAQIFVALLDSERA